MEFKSCDNKTIIYGNIWKPSKKVIGIIQIVHGITEHMDRYEEFAKYFCKKGFLVFGINVTGHGKSLYSGKIKGYFGNEGSWQSVVDDVYQSYLLIKKQYANIPYYLIGFSMGSFIVRTLMIKKDTELKINGCFLLGTGYQPPFLLKIIKILVKSNCKKVGEQNSSELIDSLAFDNYNKKFKPIETNIDWLLKNKIERDKYLNDPMVLKHISSGLFRELLTGMIFTNNKSYQLHIDYLVYLLSGKNDAVGQFGKEISKTASLLKKQGINKVEIKLFDNMRHDILHEQNYYDVYRFIEGKII